MSAPLCVIPRKQEDADCAIVALAQWTGQPYTHVAALASAVRPTALTEGLHTSQIRKVARMLGHHLKAQRAFSLEDRPSGILTLAMPDEHHAVVLFEGVIISDGKIWNYEAFLKQAKAKALTLLTEDE